MSILNLNGPAGRSPRGKRAVKVWMGIGLVIAVLGVGSTLASTISINGNTNQEFGQGVQRTVYCGGNKEITVTPVSSFLNNPEPTASASSTAEPQSESENSAPATTPPGTFYLSDIKVSDIPAECAGVDFVFSAYSANGLQDLVKFVYKTSDSSEAVTTPTVYFTGVTSGAELYTARTGNARISETKALLSVNESDHFTIHFPPAPADYSNASIDDIGRIVIETQNHISDAPTQ
jgi:hypothetical protein